MNHSWSVIIVIGSHTVYLVFRSYGELIVPTILANDLDAMTNRCCDGWLIICVWTIDADHNKWYYNNGRIITLHPWRCTYPMLTVFGLANSHIYRLHIQGNLANTLLLIKWDTSKKNDVTKLNHGGSTIFRACSFCKWSACSIAMMVAAFCPRV